MSHFTVLVIGENPDKQLAPFQENSCSEPDREYMVFESKQEDYEQEWKEEKPDAIKMKDGTYLLPSDDKFKVKGKDGFNKQVVPKGLKKTKVSFQKLYKDFDEFCHKWHGIDKDDEMGEYGYWFNPNSHWDWWMVGGRWSGMLKLKKGCKGTRGEKSWCNEQETIPADRVDSARIGDIDFEGMLKDEKILLAETWDKAQKEKKGQASFLYGITKEMTKEQYIEKNSKFSTHAVVKDGEWFEQGCMGWWGIVTDVNSEWDKEFKKLLDGLSPKTRITIIDCHI
jgi:hypothetical protein